MEKKIVVIGGGPAGYTAALEASRLGGSVTLIEKDKLGGVCTNRGCIPTKTLISLANTFNTVRKASKYGISTGNVELNVEKLFKRKDLVVNRLVRSIEHLLKKNNVNIIKGEARIESQSKVKVNGEEIEADSIIIATGSSPTIIKIPGIEQVKVLTGDEFLESNEMPDNVLIIGGGFIGIELAHILNSLNRNVTIVELMPRILPNLDEEVSLFLQGLLKRRGIKILTGTVVEKFSVEGDKSIAHLSNGEKINFDLVLMCVGRRPNSRNLGLEQLGVSLGRKGEILTDEYMETNVKGIYAAGDVAGKYYLAYTAMEEGRIAARNSLGHKVKINYDAIPIAVFSDPEIGSVGITENEAKEKYDVVVGKAQFIANSRALSLDKYEGFIKMIVDKKSRKILGAHIVGPEASELIHTIAVVMRRNGTIEDLAEAMFIHPSLSESIKDVALSIINSI